MPKTNRATSGTVIGGAPRLLSAARTHQSSRGQALVIAVLVLFAVAALAALFAAIISSHLVQVTRHSEVVELRQIGEAGLRFANEQLTYSIAGADWRPSASPYRCGRGWVDIDVTYGPAPNDLQSRFLRIVASAWLQDNPFLRHQIVALKPVLLTDYARFITDRYESNEPARLGVLGVELGGQPRADQVALGIDGPIRCNTDLIFYGSSWIHLHRVDEVVPGETDTWRDFGILRDDRIEVAGELLPGAPDLLGSMPAELALMIDTDPPFVNVFSPLAAEQSSYLYGYPDAWAGGLPVPNSQRMLATLPPITDAMGQEQRAERLALPRVRPPEIDAPETQINRYLALARDSGVWEESAGGGFHNTGAYGWAWTNRGGIYIDNLGDIQYDHDLDLLRHNWVGSIGVHQPGGDLRANGTNGPISGPADWWDKAGRYYAPPGAEIILRGDLPCPHIEIVRHDLRDIGGVLHYWRQPDGTPLLYTSAFQFPGNPCSPTPQTATLGVNGATAIFPFPPNGVIYAEGNLRVSGILPPVRSGYAPETYCRDTYDADTGRARRYDLQIVSGGTIYIEGDILTPRGAGLLTTFQEDIERGSRVALLARDYVCVNTTALNPRPADLVPRPDLAQGEYYNDAQPLYPPDTGGLLAPPYYWRFQGPQNDVNWGIDGYVAATDPVGIELVYRNVRLQQPALRQQFADLRLMLGHSGWYAVNGTPPASSAPPDPALANGDNEAEVQVQLDIRGATWPWYYTSGLYSFLRPAAADPANQDQSDHWYIDANDQLERLPNQFQAVRVQDLDLGIPVEAVQGDDLISFTCQVVPVESRPNPGDPADSWHVAPHELAYLLGSTAITPPRTADPLPVQVQALVYAQNGSWFILPGPWFNEDASSSLATEPGALYPYYHEPMNIQLSFYGAVTENMPADLGYVSEWTSKWGGPSGAADGFLRYEYDPLLRLPRQEREGLAWVPYLRFPNLPLTSDLVIWGERVSGEGGS